MGEILTRYSEDGEYQGQVIATPIKKKHKSNFNNGEWCRLNQTEWSELTMKGKGIYTAKGAVLNHLISTMQYGNFSPFNGAYLAKVLETTPQAISRAKKQLIEDKLIDEAIDTRTGAKGVIIYNGIVEKGDGEKPDYIVPLSEYKED